MTVGARGCAACKQKLVAFVVGLIATSVLLQGALFYQQLRGQLLESVAAETRSAATGYAFAIADWIGAKSQLIRAAKTAIATADAEHQFQTAGPGWRFRPGLCRLSRQANGFFRSAVAASRL
jgi:hypothetical protein